MIDPEQAWRILLDSVTPLPAKELPAEACLHRFLARPVAADRDMPPADRAAMDGYAVRSGDTAAVPARLRVAGELPAGSGASFTVRPGECVRIFTGANVPPGADAVVMQEDTRAESDEAVAILRPPAPGQHIFRRGEIARQGASLFPAGTFLDAMALAVCAATGKTGLEVHDRPRVGVLTTGAELKKAGDAVGPHESRDSNGPMLSAALCEHDFGTPACLSAPDDRATLLAALRGLLEACDVILVTGGVSVGKYDLVPLVLQEAGGEIRYHGISMKPGKPQLFAVVGGRRYVFGLPGNPLAAMTGFFEFVLPALRLLAGCPVERCRQLLNLPLASEVASKGTQWHYQLGRIVVGSAGGTAVEPLSNAGSGDLVAGSKADGMIVVPAGVQRIPAGTSVGFRPWRPLS